MATKTHIGVLCIDSRSRNDPRALFLLVDYERVGIDAATKNF